MRRFAIFVTLLVGAFGVQAQTNQKLERAAFLRDSVAGVLAEQRAKYSTDEALRKELTPVIISLEKEVVRLHAEYEKELSIVLQQEAQGAFNACMAKIEAAAKLEREKVVEKQNREEVVDNSRMKRDLVANDIFVKRLPEATYKSLRDAQKSETTVKNAVERYFTAYGELVALQRQYMEATTKEEADNITTLFNAKEGAVAKLDKEISLLWSSLYFHKIYAYDLLMERERKDSMLLFSTEVAARAEQEIRRNRDLYQSDALVGYFARKKALTEYEMQLASILSLTSSQDSLKTVMNELKNRDYSLSKLSLPRRSFIKYEKIVVKQPSIYNSSNPVPKTIVYDYGTIYRIRIGIFSTRPSISILRGVTPLSYTTDYNDGQYAYFVGGFSTEDEAKEGANRLKKMGFKEPIVAAWVDGEYYPTLEDMHRLQSLYNIEISGVTTLSDAMKAKIESYNSNCSISRVGLTFVAGTFDGKTSAEALADELRSMSKGITVKVIKK